MATNTYLGPLGEMLYAMARTATTMCNPDLYWFKAEFLESDQVIVNCYPKDGAIWDDAYNYASDLAELVAKLLNRNRNSTDYKWECDDVNYWLLADDGSGELVPAEYHDDEYPDDGECVQICIFKK